MFKKMMIGAAALISLSAISLSAQEPPKPQEQPVPRPMLSQEAQAKVDAMRNEIAAIYKAEFEKQKAEREELYNLKAKYLSKPDDEVKAKIQAILGKCFDARLAARQARLAAQQKDLDDLKAKRAEKLDAMFDAFIAAPEPQEGEMGPCPMMGPNGKKFGCPMMKDGKNPMMKKGDKGRGPWAKGAFQPLPQPPPAPAR